MSKRQTPSKYCVTYKAPTLWPTGFRHKIVTLFLGSFLLDYKLYVVQDEINVWLILD